MLASRPLGRSGISIAPLIFGGNVFGWTADEAMSFRMLDAFVAGGFSAIDTADVYSRWVPGHQGGESETIIGRWLSSRQARGKVVIATKAGSDMGPAGKGLSRAHITSAVEASLKRLQTDHIDLYQSHIDDASVPIEETLETYAVLIKAGKVRAIGASNFTAARLAQSLAASKALGVPRYETLQPEYNLMERVGFESELQGLCARENVGAITYFSLAKGFLTGKYRSEADLGKSPRGGGVKGYLTSARGLAVLAALDEIAVGVKSTPAQVALAWLMSQPAVAAPIASATTVPQLEEIMGAARLALSPEAIAKLTTASAT
jgi:aryl-alcohol dehydrogenase-like predicted oxidoreductase